MPSPPFYCVPEASAFNCASEEDTCSCCRGTTDYCYTKHAGVVISIGCNTALFARLMNQIPEARKLVVDVAELLPAPLRHTRTKAVYPDCDVVFRIREQKNYITAVRMCDEVLQKHGIVLVACKGGNHRSPTVASELKDIGRFVVHATLRTRLPLCFEDIASLVHACVVCSSRSAFYDSLIRDSEDAESDMQLCVGWTAADLKTHEVDARASYVEAGANVCILKTFEDWCCVKDNETGHTCTIPVTWLVPNSVFLRREQILPTRGDVRC